MHNTAPRPSDCVINLVTMVNGKQKIELKKEHMYYAQVQGQIAVGCLSWCEFVLYISNEHFDVDYWKNDLLP